MSEGHVTPRNRVGESDSRVRLLAVAGLCGQFIFWLVVFVLGFLTPGYSVVADYISTLGEVGAPYATVQQINFFVWGGSIVALALGFRRYASGRDGPRVGIALLALLGVGIILAGVFPQNSADPMSTTNVIHETAAIGGFFAGIIGIASISRWLDSDENWPRGRYATPLTVGILVIPFFAVAVSPSSIVGLTQRLFVAILTAWLAYHAFRLTRIQNPAADTENNDD